MSKRALEQDDEMEVADLEDLIGYNLKRAYVIVRTDFREAVGTDGLSARVFSAAKINAANIATISKLQRISGERWRRR